MRLRFLLIVFLPMATLAAMQVIVNPWLKGRMEARRKLEEAMGHRQEQVLLEQEDEERR